MFRLLCDFRQYLKNTEFVVLGFVRGLQALQPQGSHSTWKTWKNESTPGKPGNIMEF